MSRSFAKALGNSHLKRTVPVVCCCRLYVCPSIFVAMVRLRSPRGSDSNLRDLFAPDREILSHCPGKVSVLIANYVHCEVYFDPDRWSIRLGLLGMDDSRRLLSDGEFLKTGPFRPGFLKPKNSTLQLRKEELTRSHALTRKDCQCFKTRLVTFSLLW